MITVAASRRSSTGALFCPMFLLLALVLVLALACRPVRVPMACAVWQSMAEYGSAENGATHLGYTGPMDDPASFSQLPAQALEGEDREPPLPGAPLTLSVEQVEQVGKGDGAVAVGRVGTGIDWCLKYLHTWYSTTVARSSGGRHDVHSPGRAARSRRRHSLCNPRCSPAPKITGPCVFVSSDLARQVEPRQVRSLWPRRRSSR